MEYNPDNTESYYYVDDYGMVLRKPMWGEDHGERDSISRTAAAYKAWGDEKLIYAIRSCFIISLDRRGYYWESYRHPNNKDDDMSRDHVFAALLAEKHAGNKDTLKEYAKYLRYRISKKFWFTPDLWAWMKMIAGKWWWAPVYYVATYFMLAVVYVPWNKLLYWIAPFSPEKHQFEWDTLSVNEATPRQAYLRTKLYPAYTLTQLAWQLYVLKGNVFTRGLQRLALSITGRTNYLVRLLLGANDVKEIDIRGYRMMTGDRFGTTLNEACRRHVEIIKDGKWCEANRLDEDLLKKIWNERKI